MNNNTSSASENQSSQVFVGDFSVPAHLNGAGSSERQASIDTQKDTPSVFFRSDKFKDIAVFFAKMFSEQMDMISSQGCLWKPSKRTQCWSEVPDDFIKNEIWKNKNIPARIVKLNKNTGDEEEIFVEIDFHVRLVDALVEGIKLELNRDFVRAWDSKLMGFFDRREKGILTSQDFISFKDDKIAFKSPHLDQRARMYLEGGLSQTQKDLLRQGKSVRESEIFKQGLFYRMLKRYWGQDEDCEDKITAFQQVLGQIACENTIPVKDDKAVIFYGAAGSGKSTLARLASELVPEFSRSSVSFLEFSDSFKLIKIKGKTLNIIDEFSFTAVDSRLFKTIVTKGLVTASEKYKPNVSFKPTALHLGTTNVLPAFKDGLDESIKRRTLLLTFERGLNQGEKEPDLFDRVLREDIGNIIAFSVEGMLSLMKSGEYHIPPSSVDAFEWWAEETDSVTAYVKDSMVMTKNYRDFIPTQSLYADYLIWCDEKHFFNKVNKPNFPDRLITVLKGMDPKIMRVRARVEGERPRGICGIQVPLGSTRTPDFKFVHLQEEAKV